MLIHPTVRRDFPQKTADRSTQNLSLKRHGNKSVLGARVSRLHCRSCMAGCSPPNHGMGTLATQRELHPAQVVTAAAAVEPNAAAILHLAA